MSSTWLRRLLTRSSLAAGWRRVEENDGAPGVDGVTVLSFSLRLETEFMALQHEVLTGTYQPQPLLSVWLEQPGKKRRELGIPAVRDRVLQSACALLIGPTLEANFEDCSFAYRQGRSVKQAVARVEHLRDAGFCWVVDADINAFFDEIPHGLLLKELSVLIPDHKLIGLVRRWLSCPIKRGSRIEPRTKGIPQGSPLSPLLANLYLDQLDEAVLGENLRLVRFADDFLILCRKPEQAEQALELTRSVLEQLELRLNPAKTRITHFDDGFRFLGTLFIRSLAIPSKHPLDAASQSPLPPCREKDGMGVEQWNGSDSTSSLPLPLQGGGKVVANGRSGINENPARPEHIHPSDLHPLEDSLSAALSAALVDHPEWHPASPADDETAAVEHVEADKAGMVAKDDSGLDDFEPEPSGQRGQADAPDEELPESLDIEDEPPDETTDEAQTQVSNALLQTLYVIEPGSVVAREGERLVVKKEDAVLLELPAIKTDLICLFGRIPMTTAAMQLALLRGIPVALIGRNGHYYGRIEPPMSGNVELQRAQFRAMDDETFRLDMARNFLRGKLDNAAIVLQRLARTKGEAIKSAIPGIRRLSAQLKTAGSIEALNGMEGAAASAYFEAWRALLPESLGFAKRQSRPAPDAVNALLSLGYTLLYQNVAALLAARGLNPHAGIMHAAGGTHLALASDLMEELRPPLVDSVVLNLLLNERIPEPIAVVREQGTRLSPATIRIFLTAFENRMAQRATYLGGELAGDWRRLMDLQVRRLAQAVRTRDTNAYTPIRMR